jgi:hypothetical protein
LSSQSEEQFEGIALGKRWGRWGQKIVRIERRGPAEPGNAPEWFVGPKKNRNQASVHYGEYAVYLEVEDHGMSDEEVRRRSAKEIVEKTGASAELVYNSFGLEPPAESS